MNRRKFLRNSALFSAPLFLKGLPVFAGDGLTHPWLNSLARTANNCNRILIIVQLNGGNDGLNMVFPIDKWTELTAARGGTNGILMPQSSTLSLNNLGSSGTNTTTALHPSMTGIQSLYNSGKIAIVQGVSYPNPNYSHFQAQDIFFSSPATSATPLDTGWMGRTLDATYPGFPAGYPIVPSVQDPLAIQIGGALPLSLQGPNINMGYNVSNPATLVQVATATAPTAPASDYGTELTFLRQMQSQSNAYTTRISAAWNTTIAAQSSLYPTTGQNSLADQLKTVAKLIAGGLTTQVYIVNHSDSFDNHVNQVSVSGTTINPLAGSHASSLGKLSVAISAFMADMATYGKANQVTGMTFSEFGRRVLQNASYGTDHGTAAPVIFFGGALNGGVYGSSPSLPATPTSNTQVNMQYDFRQLYATILQKWMCVSATQSQSLLNITSTLNTPVPLFNSVALPNESIDISASWNGNAAEVDFFVNANDRYESFVIERSSDGAHFGASGLVSRIDSTNDGQPYRFNEPRISAPKVFYRVKGQLKNGETRFSPTAELVNGARAQALSIYPNPVTNFTIHIDFMEAITELVEVELYDMQGGRVYYNSMAPDAGRLVFRVPYGLGTYTPYIIRVKWGSVAVREQISFV